MVFRVDAVGRTERFGEFKLARVGVHGNDAAGLGLARALNNGKTNTAETEYCNGVPRLHLGGVMHCANPGGYAAAQQAYVLRVGVWVDLRDRDFRHHGVLTECRATHVVIERLAIIGKPSSAIGHNAFALGLTDRYAKVGLARLAEQAFAAFGGVQRDNVVARLEAGDTFTDLHDDASTFMAQNHRKQAFRVITRQGEGIGMAYAGIGDFDQHFAFARRRHIDLDDLKWLAWFKCNCSTGFHKGFSPSGKARMAGAA